MGDSLIYVTFISPVENRLQSLTAHVVKWWQKEFAKLFFSIVSFPEISKAVECDRNLLSIG